MKLISGADSFRKRGPSGKTKGLQYKQQAIEIDSNYALGYAGLADTYFGSFGGGVPLVGSCWMKAVAGQRISALTNREPTTSLHHPGAPLPAAGLVDRVFGTLRGCPDTLQTRSRNHHSIARNHFADSVDRQRDFLEPLH